MKLIKVSHVYHGDWIGPVYHGSTNSFEEFDLSYVNDDHTPTSDSGFIYLTGDRDYASEYGEVQEFMVNLGRYDIMFLKDVSRLKSGELDTILVAPRWNPFSNNHPSLKEIEEIVVLDPKRIKKV